MARNNREPRLEKRKVSDLRPFPRQQDFFDDLPDDVLTSLAKAMRDGQAPPIEILPQNSAGLRPNTILRGHQRCRAARLAGLKDVPVLVRYDLANASERAIELEFLVDNQNRRHQDMLSRARVALRMFELERKHPERAVTVWEEGRARDRVGKVIGMGGRNLQRYWRVLQTPIDVQNAFRAKKLSLVEASKVAGLPEKAQAEIARRIGAGEPARKVLGDYAPAKAQTAGKSLRALLRSLKLAQRELADRVGDVRGGVGSEVEIAILVGGRALLDGLIRQFEATRAESLRELERIAARWGKAGEEE